jgi:hypothetical protein
MPDTITFTSVVLKRFLRSHKGGVAVFASSLNNKVCNVMGWGIGEGQTSSHLEGQLHASSMILKPSEAALAKHKLELDIQSVGDFEAIRYEVEGKKGKGFRHEIHFKVKFGDKDGCKELERYMLTMGEGKATLQVSYVKQQELVDDDGQRLISESQAKDTTGDD